jgi:hypothetical protein
LIQKITASRFALLVPALVVVMALSYQVHCIHKSHVPTTTPVLTGASAPASDLTDMQPRVATTFATPAVLAPAPAIRSDSESSKHAQDVVLTLLAKSLPETKSHGNQVVDSAAPTPSRTKPAAMTMLSISNYDQTTALETLSIRCRTDGYLSNAAGGDHILVKGVVTEDVVSAAKILIPAGSKVAGIAHIDRDTGRLESKGNWSIFAEHDELRIQAELQDADSGFHGIAGNETSFESELSQRQAVVRDGRYCFLADKTPFVLSLRGDVSVTEVKTIAPPE